MYPDFCGPWSGGYFGGGFKMMMMIIVVGFIIWFVTREARVRRVFAVSPIEVDRSWVILKARCAYGEIDKDEFEQKKKDLL